MRDLYVLQGAFDTDQHFEAQGRVPHPDDAARPVVIVLRLQALPSPANLWSVAGRLISNWESAGFRVAGLQLDFDAASARLVEYGDYLAKIKGRMPVVYKLSITGLGDWIASAPRSSLERLSDSADEIVFQLYHGRHALSRESEYVRRLEGYAKPFKIGLLESQNLASPLYKKLRASPGYRGAIYFILPKSGESSS